MPMTIADLAAALGGIPRNAYVLIDTPNRPRPLAMVQIIHVAEQGGEVIQHAAAERPGIVIKATR